MSGSVPILQAATEGVVGSSVLVVAANTFSDTTHLDAAVLVSAKVRSWKDLEGAYIAVNSPTSLGAWAVVGRFRQEGVRKYTFVNISFQDMGLAVAGGSVSAAVMFEPYITQSLQRGDGMLLGWVIGGPPLKRDAVERADDPCRFSSGTTPRGTLALVSLHVRAVRWILHNEKAARSILGKGLSIDRKVTDAMNLLLWRPDCRNDPALWQENPIDIRLAWFPAEDDADVAPFLTRRFSRMS